MFSVITRTLGALVLCGIGFAGCANNNVSACPAWVIPANAQLLFPEPGATGVPDDFGTLIFAGEFDTPPAPIALGVGSQPQLQTTQTTVPSPLPSPAATPTSTSPAPLIFAVSVPALGAGKTYNVFAPYASGCGGGQQSIGSFTTR